MAKQEKDKKNQKHFWKDFKAELKKVIWPTKKQLANSTLAVVVMVLVIAAVVLVLDLAFDALNTYGINKVKQAVQDSVKTEETLDESASENSSEDSETENETDEDSGTELNVTEE